MQAIGLKQVVKNIWGMTSKNSPTILTGMAVAGLFSTVGLAIRATPKACILIDEWFDQRCPKSKSDLCWEDVTFLDRAKVSWRCYIPAAAVGTATIVCIIGANSINLRRNAALASMYSLTEAAFKEYQSKVTETIGRNKEVKIRDEIAKDTMQQNPASTAEIIFTGKGEVLCYDHSVSGRYFKSDIESIRRIQNEQNHKLIQEMFISLNDIYYELGLAPTKYGNEMGWNMEDGLIEFDFSSQLTDKGEPCLVIDFDVSPKFKYGQA